MKHLTHYMSLIAILGVGLLGLLYFPHSSYFQIAVAVALSAGYVTWGIVHHYIHRDLHLSVVIEYVVVACLGLVIVFSLVK